MTKGKVIEISDSETESSTGSSSSTNNIAIRPSIHFKRTTNKPTYHRRSAPPPPPSPPQPNKPTKTAARVVPPPSPPNPRRAFGHMIPLLPTSNPSMVPIPPRPPAFQIHSNAGGNAGGSGIHQQHRHHPYQRQINHPPLRTVDFLTQLEANLSEPAQVPREDPPTSEMLAEWASSLTLGNGRRKPVDLKLKLH